MQRQVKIADDASLVERVTSLQGSALDEAATSSDAAFVRAAYNRDGDGRLHLGEIRAADAYHDRRRLENGKRLVDVVKATTDPVEFERLMGPLAGRMGDLVTTWLAAATSSQNGRGSSRPIVTTAHSRLLREILFMFRINQLSILAPRASGRRKRIKYDLRWKPATDAADCLALSTDEGKLSNCGVVSMDIEVCDSCARPTLTPSLAAPSAQVARSCRVRPNQSYPPVSGRSVKAKKVPLTMPAVRHGRG